MKERSLLVAASIVFSMAILLAVGGRLSQLPNLWLTPDQQGDRLMRQKKYGDAAKRYVDPVRQGIAFYRDGDFKSATTAFSHAATPEAVFNLANSLVMRGKYSDAVKSYDRALALRPGWKEAVDNRALAVVRRDRMKPDGGDETGADLKPDEVVFEKGVKHEGESVQVDAGTPLNDQQLQALWLRRVQTKPADFMRAKFAFQSSQPATGAAP